MSVALQARATTRRAVSGVKLGNTRRSSARSSGEHDSAIASMSGTGTATHLRALAVLPCGCGSGVVSDEIEQMIEFFSTPKAAEPSWFQRFA